MATLLNHTQDHSPRVHDSKETPLHTAAAAGNLDAIDSLLKAGAAVNVRSELEDTPLHRAANSRQLVCMYLFPIDCSWLISC
eukprot:m.163484 g.163484  ORF g.163484 m.163484 type:complete len:82 (+) comp16551_c0_seq4:550-795(+)